MLNSLDHHGADALEFLQRAMDSVRAPVQFLAERAHREERVAGMERDGVISDTSVVGVVRGRGRQEQPELNGPG